ncbi:MAG: ABC transporter substrate-binding protein [Alphaproteobacteria bacterium]|nr:ABC transporter substrate-binding protein [Alphaproteobacteria bacterium]
MKAGWTRGVTLVAVLALFIPVTAARANERAIIQLRWMHQFQFAGYYAALHKGFYKDAGLDVVVKEGGSTINAEDDVLNGTADFGVDISGLVVDYLAGRPVLLLASVFQHSPSVLVARGENRQLSDLVGAGPVQVMDGVQNVNLKAMFIAEGIPLSQIQFTNTPADIDDLAMGRVAALTDYLSNYPYLLSQRGVPFTVFTPQTYGMDFYGDVLFTRHDLARTKPKMVAAFREASLKGWDYALAHPDEIIDLILDHYNTQNKTREHLRFEAKVLARMIDADVIQLGHTNPGRWRFIAETFARLGLTSKARPLDDFFYDPARKPDYAWLYPYLATAILLIMVAAAIAAHILRINRRLRLSVSQLRDATADAVRQRERADDALERERAALARYKQFAELVSHEFRNPLAVIKSKSQLMELIAAQGATPDEDSWNAINRAVGRLQTLFDQWLASETLVTGEFPFLAERIDLMPFLDSVLSLVPQSPGHRIGLEPMPEGLTIEADPALIRVALINLLDNAVKYSPRGGAIILRATPSGGRASIQVIDSGAGIAPQDQSSVFERYFRGGRDSGPAGMGLGLFMVREIARLHGGEATVDSVPGMGSTFTLSLPRLCGGVRKSAP